MSKGTRKTNIVVRHPFGNPYYPSQKKFFKKVPKYGKKGDGVGQYTSQVVWIYYKPS